MSRTFSPDPGIRSASTPTTLSSNTGLTWDGNWNIRGTRRVAWIYASSNFKVSLRSLSRALRNLIEEAIWTFRIFRTSNWNPSNHLPGQKGVGKVVWPEFRQTLLPSQLGKRFAEKAVHRFAVSEKVLNSLQMRKQTYICRRQVIETFAKLIKQLAKQVWAITYISFNYHWKLIKHEALPQLIRLLQLIHEPLSHQHPTTWLELSINPICEAH